jgi:hypothetical protein
MNRTAPLHRRAWLSAQKQAGWGSIGTSLDEFRDEIHSDLLDGAQAGVYVQASQNGAALTRTMRSMADTIHDAARRMK